MKKLFLDANIFFAATFSPSGGSAMLFELAKYKRVELLTSLYALNEAKRNILHKGGRSYLPRFYQLVSELKTIDQKVYNDSDLIKWEEWIVKKDAPILISAQGQKVDFLITLDKKDFKSKRIESAPIHFIIFNPGELIQSLKP